ncbi:MAG: recombinase family protein, partial [Clostridia bacterium]|nr:recombinase family protein [Clostridia bacterium]
ESTKKRLEELEFQKNELYSQIAKEESAKPMLTREQIVFWLQKLRQLNTNKLEHRRKLIDSFINAIFLYDDRMVITFNYKDSTREITFKDLESLGLGSDFTDFGAPKTARNSNWVMRCFYKLFAKKNRLF